MLRSALIAGLWLVTPILTQAQVTKAPEIEVFGGLSYLNVAGYDEREHFANVATGVTVKVNKRFGIVADFGLPLAGPSDRFLSTIGGFPFETPRTVYAGRRSTTATTALFGPRFFLRRDNITLFAHGLAGVVRTKNSSEYSLVSGIAPPLIPVSYSYSVNHFGYGLGGGIDVNLNRRFAIRLVQADYLRTRVEVMGNQLRLQTGVVVRFGGSH